MEGLLGGANSLALINIQLAAWRAAYTPPGERGHPGRTSPPAGGGGGGGEKVGAETLYHRDDALRYIAYVILIWAAPIPADRWHCSLWP